MMIVVTTKLVVTTKSVAEAYQCTNCNIGFDNKNNRRLDDGLDDDKMNSIRQSFIRDTERRGWETQKTGATIEEH